MTPHHPGKTPRTSWRGILLAILLGLVLGTLISVGVVWLRPVPTGIAGVEVVEFARDPGGGRSWVLDLEVDRAGYPFLFHLDDAGLASLLFPDGDVAALQAGDRCRLPDASGHRAWRTPGGELYVLVSATPYLGLDHLFRSTELAAAQAGSDEAAVRAVRKVLRKQLGPGVFVQVPEAH